MATSYKTPGVYVEEISKLPPSVAQVETAIPAFVGYTQKAEKNGESLINKPTRLSSMVEFIECYGGQREPESITVSLDEDNNYAVISVDMDLGQRFFMYDSLRLFFDNGGGDCYIVSVGVFETSDGTNNEVVSGDENDPVNSRGLRVGVAVLEKYDEPTIILFPDAVLLEEEDELFSLQQMAIAQCAKLQDRVTVLDLKENTADDLDDAVQDFRDKIGINNLKYAAAYTPWLIATYSRVVNYEQFSETLEDSGGTAITDLTTLSTDANLNELLTNLQAAVDDNNDVLTAVEAICDSTDEGVVNPGASGALASPSMRDRYKFFSDALKAATDNAGVTAAYDKLVTFVRNAAIRLQSWKADFSSTNLTNDVNSYAASASLWRGGVTALIELEKNVDSLAISALVDVAAIEALYGTIDATWLGSLVTAIAADTTDYGTTATIPQFKATALALEREYKASFEMIALFADTIVAAADTYRKASQDILYDQHTVIGNIVKAIKKALNEIPPSGAIAGIYARVDNARGVWKAPANESLNSVSGPAEMITAQDQERLNVDAVAGKSINAIRAFTGKGTLVWGARTLAGNDNEWRYVSVRRFFNMVEESTKKATEPFVFEPNDANTWVKIQGMIENFLTTLWRQGALQGAKPEHAFYVAVGLGKTMTSLDILEGRLIVEIGMAVVRPAEFIILRFSHKLAES